ncbi:MAG: extracellular solute-binding protein [Firmicutes bacterium]|nr:extracellular solute-binding protein [Bacillota bacterium]
MRRTLTWALAALICLSGTFTMGVAAQPKIEDELVLITPVAKFVVDAALAEFVKYAKETWGVTLKASATNAGTPICYGKIVEWNGRPQADIFWGGESVLFESLIAQGLIQKHEVPQDLISQVPQHIGTPKPLPLRDAAGYWVGTALEPYGLIYHPKVLQRLGVSEIKAWDDLLNPKLKGWVAQCTPDRSSSSHASYEVILQMYGWEKGWQYIERLAANTGQFVARSRDVPSVVAKGEYGVGFAVPSYMAFEEVLNGYPLKFVAPPNCYVTPEPISVLAGCPHPVAAKAFIAFLLTERGQKVFMERGLFPITPKYRVSGAPGSTAERAVEFTGGVRSYFDQPVANVYDHQLAGDRTEQVNDYFRRNIMEQWDAIKKKY